MPNSPLPVFRLDIPCQMPWEEMIPVNGQPHVRHCNRCNLDVRDLSAMPADEAAAYLHRQRGRTCVSFLHDESGAVMTLDYQRPAASRRWPAPVAAGVAAAALAVGAAALIPDSLGLTRARGGMIARPYGAYSPFSPGSNLACATQTRLLPIQLQQDASLQPLLAALPSGVEVVDLQYNVHPAGLPEDLGRCIALGRREGGAGELVRHRSMPSSGSCRTTTPAPTTSPPPRRRPTPSVRSDCSNRRPAEMC